MTALHFAAKAGHVNIINMLLNTDRLNIDTTDDGGWTPLIWAAEHMEVEAVKLLLKRKADPNLRDSVSYVLIIEVSFIKIIIF
jgi:euchromatic histone-lysine N-methyltransferase